MRREERAARKARAIELRLAGHSTSQIARALGVKTGGRALGEWLRGVPPPEWTKRPRAKDDAREKAVAMRLEGRSYREIKEILGVSKSSLSLWLKGVPLTDEHRAALRERQGDANRLRAVSIRAARIARERRIVSEATSQVAHLAESELFVAGVVAYWAEGTKSKPWGKRERVTFINSDPGMIVLFLRWLNLLGIDKERLSFRVYIHESADVAEAVRYWSTVVGVPTDRFLRPTLKRHNPRTVRRNVGGGYRGCVTVVVRRSSDLSRKIEGWFGGIVGALSVGQGLSRVDSLAHTGVDSSGVV